MNNTIILENALAAFMKRNDIERLGEHEAFQLFALRQITKDYDLSDNDIDSSIVDGGQDGGIDSIIVLVNDQFIATKDELEDIDFGQHTHVHVMISQVKYEPSFREDPIDKLHISMPPVLNLELTDDALLRRFNSGLVERVQLLRQAWLQCASKGGHFSIAFIYASKANEISVNDSFQQKENQLIDLTKHSISRANVVFSKYSAKELMELFGRPRSQTMELRFKENPIPVPFIDDEYGYVGVVSLEDYFTFINKEPGRINEQIFDSNVRHFQGSVDVNTKIKATLESDFARDFWWLNNGITVIVSECRSVPKALFLTDVQIVNGLQTSFLIANHYTPGNQSDSRSLLVKVVITKNKETIDKIIRASNSQTPVSHAVLRATDEIQRQIEFFFAGSGYWYDRRKNYYKNQGKPARSTFGIQQTAQAIETVLHKNPAAARSSPTGIVKSDKSYERIFDPHVDFTAYLNCCLLDRQVRDFIKTELERDSKNQARNFSFHTTRILASVLTGRADYTTTDVANLSDASIHDANNTRRAYQFLGLILTKYQKHNPDENIINVAKSRRFSEMLNQEIAQLLSIPDL